MWTSGTIFLTCYVALLSSAAGDSDEGHVFTLAPMTACNRHPVPDVPGQYIVTYGLYWAIHDCPRHTIFDQHVCECIYTYHDFSATPGPFQVFDFQPYMDRSTLKTPTLPPTPKPTPTPRITTTTPKPTTTTTRTTRKTTTTTTTTTPAPTTTTTTARPTTRRPTTRKHILSPIRLFFPSPVVTKKPIVLHDINSLERDTTTLTPERMCDGCTFDRGVGYKGHQSDCNKYIMCYTTVFKGSLHGQVRQCGVGKYWDSTHLTCKPSHQVTCPFERCQREPLLQTYAYMGDCRAYWRCVGGVSVGACCPRGMGFREGRGCVPDPSCNTGACDTDNGQKDCDKVTAPGEPQKFRQLVPGRGYVKMSCAVGTIFNEATCSCDTDSRTTKTPGKSCKQELEMDFTSSLTDTSDSGIHVESVNVSLEDGSACFHGNSALIIPRFSNTEIGANLRIYIRYKHSNGGLPVQTPQALVYNGDCGQDSSIVILSDKHTTSFKLRNTDKIYKTLKVPSTKKANRWQEAMFTFHKNLMTISENGATTGKHLVGSVDRSRCGLKIGWGQDYDSFKGCIDKISISFCPPVNR